MSEAERDEALALVLAHGHEAVSFRIADKSVGRVVLPGRGVAGFVDVGRTRVLVGSPVAATDDDRDALRAAAHRTGRVVAFGRELAEDEPLPAQAYVVGEEPWWQPERWPEIVASHRSLRAQLRRAKNKGVRVDEVTAEALAPGTAIRAEAEALVARWIRTRHLEPMSFVASLAPFENAAARRYFVARAGDRLCGILIASPIPARAAWIIEHVLRTRTAANGTSEVLIDAAMRAFASDGVAVVTLGLCPLAGRVPAPLSLVRRLTRGLFDFQGLYEFKAKLQPHGWQRVLVEHPDQTAALATLRALRAFAGGSLVSFALRTMLRGPPFVIRAIAIALVPWTLALALADASWFPSPAVKWAWVAFDVLLLVALLLLARRIQRRLVLRRLHIALATMTALDAVVTAAQAALWNASRIAGAQEAVVIAVACVAPAAASVVLWSALRHREKASDRG